MEGCWERWGRETLMWEKYVIRWPPACSWNGAGKQICSPGTCLWPGIECMTLWCMANALLLSHTNRALFWEGKISLLLLLLLLNWLGWHWWTKSYRFQVYNSVMSSAHCIVCSPPESTFALFYLLPPPFLCFWCVSSQSQGPQGRSQYPSSLNCRGLQPARVQYPVRIFMAQQPVFVPGKYRPEC